MAKREPGYCLHKGTGQAFVKLDGKAYYLGEYGSEESRKRYESLKAEWLTNRHASKFKPPASSGPTIAELCLAYLDFAEAYYKTGSEYKNLKLAVQPLSELFATMPAKDFGILQFRSCRDWWLKPGTRSRQYVNKQMKRLLRVFKWMTGEGLIPSSIYESLRCVASLQRGRTEAKEAPRILPVEHRIVKATLPHMTQVLRDMVEFQLLVGCRPGEVCSIKPCMVDRSGDVWTITLVEHKGAWRGHERFIYVGPKGQAILSKYLLRSSDTYCFSPIESEKQRLEARHAARVTPLSCGNKPGSNVARKPRKKPGECFTAGTYARSIRSACLRGEVTPWAPNQLRHLAATKIRKQFGLEAASVLLGHAELSVTQVYAEQDKTKAVSVARQVG
jgi:integrase